ncbi:MAG: YHS domain-containing (seleno)protein, partial [Pseudomonadota bacterium]
MARLTRRQSLALLACLPANRAAAGPYYIDGEGLALRGYDPVAYFQQETAQKGARDNRVRWDGALWQFETDENAALFQASPGVYLPEYGGYCAEGIARGFTRISDPTVWVMVNGKLYLHYTIEAQNRWASDIRGHIRLA